MLYTISSHHNTNIEKSIKSFNNELTYSRPESYSNIKAAVNNISNLFTNFSDKDLYNTHLTSVAEIISGKEYIVKEDYENNFNKWLEKNTSRNRINFFS